MKDLYNKYCPFCKEYYVLKDFNNKYCPKCGKQVPKLGTIRDIFGRIIE